LVLAVLTVSATQSSGVTLTPEQQGRTIFEEADKRNSGYGDLEVELQMILRTARGVATQRNLRIKQLEVPQDGDKMLVVFDTPADIRGTALLSHAHKFEDDDQWLFLPAIKRVKKIASRNKSGSFVGSEFSYEDLATPELEKYTYRYLRDDVVDDAPCFVVERISIDEYSGYAKEHFWLDQDAYRVRRVDYFDHADRAVKLLVLSDYQLYADSFWKAGRMVMQNLLNRKSTELVWQNYEFRVGLDAVRDFSVNSLRRAR
jgi:hypothetical protein